MNKTKNSKKCAGTIYKINGKSFCVGEKNKSKKKRSKKNLRVKLKNKSKKLY
jgi:hypothetical protein